MSPYVPTRPAHAAGPLIRVIVQVVVAGIAVLSRALPAAYQEALQNARKSGAGSAAAAGASDGAQAMFGRKIMSVSEAMQVLNVTEEAVSKDPEIVAKQFDRYFAANAVEKGGSFYLQSKIYRAKEQLDEYIKEKRREEQMEQKMDSNSDLEDGDDNVEKPRNHEQKARGEQKEERRQ